MLYSAAVVNLVTKGVKKVSPFFIPYTITNMGGAMLAIDQVLEQAMKQHKQHIHDASGLRCFTGHATLTVL